MHFLIYPPFIPNNILTHNQTTNPHFTQEPVLMGRTARRDSPIKLPVEQFERLIGDVRKLLAAEACQVFKVDEEGAKYTVTLSMLDEAIQWMKRDAEEEEDEEPVKEEKPVEVKPEEPAPVVESGPAAEIPAPLATPPVEETPAPVEPVVEAKVEETPAPAPEAPVAEEPVKKKGKGKKTQE